MSDYFTRLAERTLGATSLPRPVIPSRFERPSAGSLDEEDVEAFAAPARLSLSTETAPPPAGPPEVGPDLVGVDARAAGPLTPPAPDVLERRTIREPDAVPIHALSDQVGRVDQVIARESERVVVEREAVRTPPPSPPQVLPASPTPPQPRIETRVITPMPAAPGIERETDRAAADPAVIHVTIGRVDIRAVSAPPPSRERQHAPRSPRPSLEEYLRRGGGQP